MVLRSAVVGLSGVLQAWDGQAARPEVVLLRLLLLLRVAVKDVLCLLLEVLRVRG